MLLADLIKVSYIRQTIRHVDSEKKNIIEVPLQVVSGHRYFLSVFVDVHVHDKQV